MSERFDDLARGLSKSHSRRGALKLIGGAAVAAVGAAVLRPLRSSAVTCPAGATVCGAGCCNKGDTCSRPAASCCCAKGTTPCGVKCCAKGVACIDADSGLCGCPAGQACRSGCPTALSLATASACLSSTTTTCQPDGSACTSAGQCCANFCTSNGFCGCRADTETCGIDTDCCNHTGGQGCTGAGTCGTICFTGSTRVLMADGSERPIEDIEAGDVVLGSNGQPNLVLGVKAPDLGRRLLYAFNGDDYFVTAEHPFLTTGGWKAVDPIRAAEEHSGVAATHLRVGDDLFAAESRPLDGVCGNVLTATALRTVALATMRSRADDPALIVYSLKVDGDRTYFANGFVVHNY
jgi:hypothetical protein